MFLECLDKRENLIINISNNFKENNYLNNVKMIANRNNVLYGNEANINLILTNNNLNKIVQNEDNEIKEIEYKNKLDNIIHNFEEEKRIKNEEISDLNNQLLKLEEEIDKLKLGKVDDEDIKIKLMEKLEELENKNNDLVKEIEDKITALEQMKKIEKNELLENDVENEVVKLEKKYEEMQTNWNDYVSQIRNNIQEMKTSIELKKNEYQYKYDQIAILKQEIQDISVKISMKKEMAEFLNEEFQKIPMNLNRNVFINRISELTAKINEERKKIKTYLNELEQTNKNIEKMNATIKISENALEDIIFKDAKANTKLKDVYSAFIKLRDGYIMCQKNIIEVSLQKVKMNELCNQVDYYKQKISGYDIKQLKEQIQLLKENIN